MIKTHFVQAWHLLRQNKLFSGIYIFGTALAIASTTIFAIIYYVKLAPVYPEYNRDKISTLTDMEVELEDGYATSGSMSYEALTKYIYPMKNAQAITAVMSNWEPSLINPGNNRPMIQSELKATDPAFFEVFNYDFIAGAPFSQTDFDSGLRKAVISDRKADEIFGGAGKAIGNTITVDFIKYEVCGVFREGCAINKMSYADVVVPYTTDKYYKSRGWMHELIGRYDVVFLSDDREALKAELDEIVRRYVTSHDGRKIEIWDQPEPITLQAFKLSPDEDGFDIKKIIRMNLLILLTLLIVPALNLSGMIAGRMDSRRSELGIRKSFGATRRTLLGQVLWENLFLTIIGGISGLAITWIILSTDATGIFSIIGGSSRDLQSHISIHLTPDMMFAPAVFAFAFLICVCLNLLSAVIPAWLSLRRPIVNCIK